MYGTGCLAFRMLAELDYTLFVGVETCIDGSTKLLEPLPWYLLSSPYLLLLEIIAVLITVLWYIRVRSTVVLSSRPDLAPACIQRELSAPHACSAARFRFSMLLIYVDEWIINQLAPSFNSSGPRSQYPLLCLSIAVVITVCATG